MARTHESLEEPRAIRGPKELITTAARGAAESARTGRSIKARGENCTLSAQQQQLECARDSEARAVESQPPFHRRSLAPATDAVARTHG
mmetsp:Transcript_5476/g.16221  ORF Transcript_5476/g.16221 Transcript_5476/m.16221 type:complete len:89 (-) Transcript_5476:113-379(-)